MDQSKVKKILILEDEPDLIEVYRDFLGGIDEVSFSITEASSGAPGFLEASTVQFDLIISDLHMPKMSGEEFLKEILDQGPNKNTPIFVISGYIDENVRKKYQGIERIQLIPKPVDLADLERKIKAVL